MLLMIFDDFGSVSDSEFCVDVLLSMLKVIVVEVTESCSLSIVKPALLSQELEVEHGFASFWEMEDLVLGTGVGSYTSEGFGLLQPRPQPPLAASMVLRSFFFFEDMSG